MEPKQMNPTKMMKPRARRCVAYALAAFCVLGAIGLCFTREWKLDRIFLLSCVLVSIAALLYYVIALQHRISQLKRAGSSNPVTRFVVKEPTLVEEPVPADNKPQTKVSPTQEDTEQTRKADEIRELLTSFEEKVANVFEQKVQESGEAEAAKMLEELVDIALLSMDFAHAFNRSYCSYAEPVKKMIRKDTTKEDVLLQTDGNIRLAQKYDKLGKILHKYLPDSSFFYSGYKL